MFARFWAKPNVEHLVLRELGRTLEVEAHETKFIESDNVSEKSKAKRLVHLFQCDLLPGISGQILASKDRRDSLLANKAAVVSAKAKVLGYAVILLANAGMVFYVFLFTLQQSKSRQTAWLQSFLLWLCTEILFVSTLTVLVVHFIVPSFVMEDVKKLRTKFADLLDDYKKKMSEGVNATELVSAKSFNAADYFFVSRKLAHRVPQIRVAQIIAQFSTPWPRQSFQHVRDVSQSYNKGLMSVLASFGGILLLFVITSFINLPFAMQDAVVHMTGTVTVAYLVLLHTELFNVLPVLAFLPLFVFGILIHFIVQICRPQANRRDNKIQPIDTIVSDDGETTRNHPTRRMSLVHGANLARILQEQVGSNSDISDSEFTISGFDDQDEGDVLESDTASGKESKLSEERDACNDNDQDSNDFSLAINMARVAERVVDICSLSSSDVTNSDINKFSTYGRAIVSKKELALAMERAHVEVDNENEDENESSDLNNCTLDSQNGQSMLDKMVRMMLKKVNAASQLQN